MIKNLHSISEDSLLKKDVLTLIDIEAQLLDLKESLKQFEYLAILDENLLFDIF